jgi:hypothetical protein
MMLKVMAIPEPMALLKGRAFRCAVERFFYHLRASKVAEKTQPEVILKGRSFSYAVASALFLSSRIRLQPVRDLLFEVFSKLFSPRKCNVSLD